MKNAWKILLFIGTLGVVLTFLGGKDVIRMSKDPIQMESVDWGTLEAGDHVQITVDMIWGQVYTETTDETTFGITTSSRESGRGYAIPHLFVDSQGYYDIDYYIGLRVSNSSDYPVVEQILKESDDWYYDETGMLDYGMTTYYVDGILEKMSSDEKELMEEYLLACGYNNSEISQMMCPYMITKVNVGASKTTMGIGIFFDVVLLVILGFMFFQNKKEKEQFANNTYMGITQTGSTDVYGGVNYGGNNFGGTDYGASNQYNNTYDGSVYGDTSYGGTNTYGQSSSYGATDTYGQSSSYGATETYSQSSSYGTTDTYGQNSTYGTSDSYANNSTYGSSYGAQENQNNDWPWQPKQ